MHPILAAAAFGAFKALVTRRRLPTRNAFSASPVDTCLVGPLREEAMYRALPAALGVHPLPFAVSFGVDHALPEQRRFELSGVETAARFADAFAGAIIYQIAFSELGFFGAVGAHAAHNAAIELFGDRQ